MIKKKLTFFALIIFLLSGCAFAYFNTFFNAKKYYNQAYSQEKTNGKTSQAAKKNYKKAIEKCGVVLTDFKDSKWADDALFLMAKSFYYRGNGYVTAKEKFNDLLKFFPESEFVSESIIFIAKSEYALNHKDKAYSILVEFIQNPDHKDKHPEALLVLSNYYVENEHYQKALHYLRKLIDNYKKSDEFQETYFLLAKTYHKIEDYEESSRICDEILSSRVEKRIKLNTLYLKAYNFLLLNKFEESHKLSEKLLRKEFVVNKIPKIRLLLARSEIGLGNYEKAIELMELIIKDNERNAIGAETAYYFGELYFSKLLDYEKAIENFNKVKTMDSRSEFVKLALSKSTVASQILQFQDTDRTISTKDLVEEQFVLAEYYLDELEMPDSALAVYDRILYQKDILLCNIDSLNILIDEINTNLDSLLTSDSLQAISDTVESDSSIISLDEKIIEDSLQNVSGIIKTESTIDSTKILDDGKSISLLQQDSVNIVFEDSLLVIENGDKETIVKPPLKRTYQNTLDSLQTRKKSFEDDVIKYEKKFIPFTLFVKSWIYKKILKDTLNATKQLEFMKENYADNKYTFALERLINNQKLEITTPEFLAASNDYNEAIQDATINPEITINRLQNFIEKYDNKFNKKARFSIGFISYYSLADTITAKVYFDSLLSENSSSQYSQFINKIYDGENFITTYRLPYFEDLDLKELEQMQLSDEEINSDSLEISPQNPENDSLNVSFPAKHNLENRLLETEDARP